MKPWIHILALASCYNPVSIAAQLQVAHTVNIARHSHTAVRNSTPITIQLPSIQLSTIEKQTLKTRMSIPYTAMPMAQELPIAHHLNMHHTPVLDQGMHGSCVMFAVTGVLNSLLHGGDFISQLCQLELGSYLAIHDKSPVSGWDGAWADTTLSHIDKYGVISKRHQEQSGCADVYQYPIDNPNNQGSPMSTAQFTEHSFPIGNMIEWTPLITQQDSLYNTHNTPANFVWMIKESLAKGHFITMGFLIDDNIPGAGTQGHYKAEYDTWMMTPEIYNDAMRDAISSAHEIIIIGYDDSIQVKDDEGHSNTGVFILRNSWSEEAGDQGNYYMTYDYFSHLVLDAMQYSLKHHG